MRILCIYPGMDFTLNDNAYMLDYLRRKDCKLMIICSKMCDLKSSRIMPSYEFVNDIHIHRIYDNFREQSAIIPRKFGTVLLLAKQFRPDIIFCSQQFNMFIASRLQKELGKPIVLLVEFAKDPINLLKRKWYLGLKFMAPFISSFYWNWLSKKTAIIITSNPEDIPYISVMQKKDIVMYYLPWCTHIPDNIQSLPEIKKLDRIIYVGSISKWKNSIEFKKTIPILLSKTPIREIVIIGPILQKGILEPLLNQYENIHYHPTLPRNDTLKLIKESFLSYTPVKIGGWGFIGDSWGVKTPLVVTHNHYYFNDGIDSMVVVDLNKIHETVNELYNRPVLYKNIQEEGWRRYLNNHSAESVGQRLFEILQVVVD